MTLKELKKAIPGRRGYVLQQQDVDNVVDVFKELDTPLDRRAGEDMLYRNFFDHMDEVLLDTQRRYKLIDYAKAIKFVSYTVFMDYTNPEAFSYSHADVLNSDLSDNRKNQGAYSYNNSKLVSVLRGVVDIDLAIVFAPKRVQVLKGMAVMAENEDATNNERIKAADVFLNHTAKIIDNAPKIDVNIKNETHVHEAAELDYVNVLKELQNVSMGMKRQLEAGTTTVEELGRLQIVN